MRWQGLLLLFSSPAVGALCEAAWHPHLQRTCQDGATQLKPKQELRTAPVLLQVTGRNNCPCAAHTLVQTEQAAVQSKAKDARSFRGSTELSTAAGQAPQAPSAAARPRGMQQAPGPTSVQPVRPVAMQQFQARQAAAAELQERAQLQMQESLLLREARAVEQRLGESENSLQARALADLEARMAEREQVQMQDHRLLELEQQQMQQQQYLMQYGMYPYAQGASQMVPQMGMQVGQAPPMGMMQMGPQPYHAFQAAYAGMPQQVYGPMWQPLQAVPPAVQPIAPMMR